MKRQDPQQQIIIYIDVPSVDEYLKKVEKSGRSGVIPQSRYSRRWAISPSALTRKKTASVFGRIIPKPSNTQP